MLIAITKLSHDKSVEQGKESLNAIANVTTAVLLAGAGAGAGAGWRCSCQYGRVRGWNILDANHRDPFR